jgi:PKD domain/EGF-like domain
MRLLPPACLALLLAACGGSSAQPQLQPQSDACSPSPCQNGATCSASGAAATCTCASGFTGATCAQHLPAVTALTLPSPAAQGAALSFSAQLSDPDGLVSQVAWTFGDGATASDTSFTRAGGVLTSMVSHTYAASGSFTVGVSAGSASRSSALTVTASSSAGCSVTSWDVTAPGFFYAFSGVTGNNPALTVCKGQRFTFHLQNLPSIHPFCIWNGGDQNAPAGVTGNCQSGTTDLVWDVPADFSGTARYICDVHFFGNAFTVQ